MSARLGEYDLDAMRSRGLVAYELLSGSHMYGTNTPDSDVDLRGVFVLPREELDVIDAVGFVDEVKSESEDVKYFLLRKFVGMATRCNPNVLEMLWPPPAVVRVWTNVSRFLVSKRSTFLCRNAIADAYVNYAGDQIAKATGQNKMVNNPEPEDPPRKEDHCRFFMFAPQADRLPFRPVPLSKSGTDLSKCHCSAVEHSNDMYRLYYYGDGAKGVFRGDGMLVCESIPFDDESSRFIGVLQYNRDGYEKSLRQWRRYWTWRRSRNEKRWVGQDGDNFQYDRKNMQHCFRLLMCGRHFVRRGCPIVRFDGDDLRFLRSVRAGDIPYHDLIKTAASMTEEINASESPLPPAVDVDAANMVYREAVEMVAKDGVVTSRFEGT